MISDVYQSDRLVHGDTGRLHGWTHSCFLRYPMLHKAGVLPVLKNEASKLFLLQQFLEKSLKRESGGEIQS